MTSIEQEVIASINKQASQEKAGESEHECSRSCTNLDVATAATGIAIVDWDALRWDKKSKLPKDVLVRSISQVCADHDTMNKLLPGIEYSRYRENIGGTRFWNMASIMVVLLPWKLLAYSEITRSTGTK